jgi:hypothetical protein
MKAALLYIVLSREPGKPFKAVSDPITREEAAVVVEKEWAMRRHAKRVLQHLVKSKAA